MFTFEETHTEACEHSTKTALTTQSRYFLFDLAPKSVTKKVDRSSLISLSFTLSRADEKQRERCSKATKTTLATKSPSPWSFAPKKKPPCTKKKIRQKPRFLGRRNVFPRVLLRRKTKLSTLRKLCRKSQSSFPRRRPRNQL